VKDEEIVTALAEKIMGLSGAFEGSCYASSEAEHFNPLTDDEDFCDLLDEVAKFALIALQIVNTRIFKHLPQTYSYTKGWLCNIDSPTGQTSEHFVPGTTPSSRRRALAIGVLKAYGLYVGQHGKCLTS